MSKFKKIFMIILAILPFLIAIGFSTWIIINVKEFNDSPQYNYKDVIKDAYDGQYKDYTGNALGPDSTYEEEIIDSDSFLFEYYDTVNSTWISGLPVESGTYTVRVKNNYDTSSQGVEITFTINKSGQQLTVKDLEVIYDGENHQIDESSIVVNFGNKSEGSLVITGNIARKDVGTTVVTIKVLGNNNFNEFNSSVSIIVKPKDISSDDITAQVKTNYVYDGTKKEPSYEDLLLTYNGMILNNNHDYSDYEVTGYGENINATNGNKTASVTIKGIGNYTGTKTIYFDIAKADQTPTFDKSKVYDGLAASINVTTNSSITATPVVTFYNQNYETISNPTDVAATGSKYFIRVIIDGNDNYNDYDSGYVEYVINPYDLTTLKDNEIQLLGELVYTGSSIKPNVTFTIGGIPISTDSYSLSYDDNINVSSGGKVYINPKGNNFINSKTISFNILPKNISTDGKATFNDSIALVYKGINIEPINGVELSNYSNVTFVVQYSNNLNAGTASYIVNGTGNYTGSISGTFTIDKANAVFTGTIPDIIASYGQILSDHSSKLPKNVVWEDPSQSVGNITSTGNKFNALYNPDENNYYSDNVEVNVIVKKIRPTITSFEDLYVKYNTPYNITPSVKGIDGSDVPYQLKYFNSENEELSQAPSAIGNYYVKLVVNTDIYECELTINLIIKNVIKVVLTDSEYDYNKTERSATFVIYDSDGNDITSTISYDMYSIEYQKNNVVVTEVKNAGNYVATLTWIDNQNYQLSDDSDLNCNIIINKLNVNIDFETESIYNESLKVKLKEVEYNKQSPTVQSVGYSISGPSDALISNDFTLEITDNNDNVIAPENVISIGQYLFTIKYDSTNYTLTGYDKALLKITKIKIQIVSTLYEYSYGTNAFSNYTALYTQLLADIQFKGVTSGEVVEVSETISDLYDGLTTYSTKTASVVGTTYRTYVNVNDSDYELVDAGTTGVPVYVKYATVIGTGSKYYTIEDALNSSDAGNLVLCGNATTYVITSFTSLSYYGTAQFNLSGRTLLVPYESNGNTYKFGDTVSGSVYSVLNIPEGITLNVIGGSTLTVGAFLGYKQPRTTEVCARGVIMNDGLINVGSNSSNGTLNAYGFIKSSSKDSNGLVKVYNGSTALDCMSTYDWPGGNTSTKIFSTVLPMNAWTVHNISCAVRIDGGGIYKAAFYADPGTKTYTSFNVITGDSTANCLFAALNNDSYIIKKTTPSAINPTATDLYTITGSNQINGQKDIVEMYGTFSDSVLKIDIATGITTSKSVACPLGYLDVVLRSGTQLTLSNSDYLFLPGTTLTVEDGSTLNVSSGVDLSFETVNNINSVSATSYSFITHFVDTNIGDSKMILSGTLNCSGNIGGLIIPGKNGVVLNLTNSTITSSFYSLYNAVGSRATSEAPVAYQVTSFPVSGYITSDGTEPTVRSTFSKSTYTSIQIGDKYYWSGIVGSDSVNGSFNASALKIGGCLAEGTLITMADGTKKKVEDILPGDLLIVFNHETGKYETAEVLFNDSELIDNYTIINLEFSNGSVVSVVYEHGFFDLDLMKYVYIDEHNYMDYVGHRFVASTYVDGEVVQSIVTLDNAFLTEEYIRIYSPVTKYHMNYITEDILSMPGGIEGLFNIFEYDDNLQYNEEQMQKDIETYGLFTYEDFKDLVSYEVYCSFPAAYFKVALGKGILTWEDLEYYIARYAPLV